MADSDAVTVYRPTLAQALKLHAEREVKLQECGHHNEETSVPTAIDTVKEGMVELRALYERNLGFTLSAEHTGEKVQQVFD